MVCANCAHIELRAADLAAVEALAAGGLRGVRFVEFPRGAEVPTGTDAARTMLGEPDQPSEPRLPATADATPGMGHIRAGIDDSLPSLQSGARESLYQTAERLQAKRRRPAKDETAPRTGCGLTIFLVVTALGVATWLLFGRTEASDTPVSTPSASVLAPPALSLSDLPGAPHAIDPGTIIDQMRRASGLGPNAILTQIEGVFVALNGTVDLDNPHYKGRIVYRFESKTAAREPIPRPDGVPPGVPGADGQPPPLYRSRAVEVNANGIRIVERTDWPTNRAQVLEPEILPRCSFGQIWAGARAQDAPSDAVATVKYTISGGRPAWWFQIENTTFGFSFNPATCTRY